MEAVERLSADEEVSQEHEQAGGVVESSPGSGGETGEEDLLEAQASEEMVDDGEGAEVGGVESERPAGRHSPREGQAQQVDKGCGH